MPVGPAESAELSARFHVRLEIEKHAGNAAAAQLVRRASADKPRKSRRIHSWRAVADVGGHEVLERVFVDVPLPRGRAPDGDSP